MLAEERRRRLAAAMRQADLQALVVYGNAWQMEYLRYAADFAILEGNAVAIVTAEGKVELLLDSAVEAERAAEETEDVTITLAGDLVAAVGRQLDQIANQRIAAVPRRFLPGWLADAGRHFTLGDGAELLETLLAEKLPAELAAFRQATILADEGYEIFKSAAALGRRQFELVAAVEGFLRSKGAADNFMIIGSGGPDVTGMAPPSGRRLARGDLVTTELTPSVDGYYSQICRTLVMGPASDAQRRAFAVYLEALEAGIAAVRPGVTAADVARAENDVFRRYGLGDYVTSKYTRVRGHGLGLTPDGRPQILESVDTVLKPGMTLIVHPNTYHPEVGYLVLGDALIVTETGAEVLCRTPRELFEIPV